MSHIPTTAYREIITNSTDAVVILDPQGCYLEQNPAHQQLMGYSDEELRGKTPAIHAGEELFEKIGQDLQEKGSFRGELASHTREGALIHVELLAFSVLDEAGEVALLATALAKTGEPAAEAPLLDAVEQWSLESSEAVESCVWALGQVGTAASVPALRRLVDDNGSFGAEKDAAEAALAEIKGRLADVETGTLALSAPSPEGALSFARDEGTLALSEEAGAVALAGDETEGTK